MYDEEMEESQEAEMTPNDEEIARAEEAFSPTKGKSRENLPENNFGQDLQVPSEQGMEKTEQDLEIEAKLIISKIYEAPRYVDPRFRKDAKRSVIALSGEAKEKNQERAK